MSEQPNPSDFSRNEKERDYTAIIQVKGEIRFHIEADNEEDARRQAEAEVERLQAERYVEVDYVDDVDLGHVRKDPGMFRVFRDGKTMQVSRLQPGDAPRPPDEKGF